LLCPEATRQRGPGTAEVRVPVGDPRAVEYGGPTTAYEFPVIDPTALSANQSLIASYGINNWVYDPPPGVTEIQGRNTQWNWRRFDAPQPTTVPLFADSMWRGGGPYATDPPPAFNGEWLGAGAEMHHFAIKRHGKGVNLLFFDTSARRVRVRELWTLQWHRNFDTTAASKMKFPAWMN
jgi:prepilin-type processing-associated H-X9-DG protein